MLRRHTYSPNKPVEGVVTTNTVRHLLWNHIYDVVDFVQIHILSPTIGVNGLMFLDQPEYYIKPFTTTNSNNNNTLAP